MHINNAFNMTNIYICSINFVQGGYVKIEVFIKIDLAYIF